MSLRVLIVHNRYRHAGGEDSVVTAEADLLRARGHDVEVYLRSNDELVSVPKYKAAAQTLWSSRTVRELRGVVESFRPDVVHVHNTFPLISPSIYWAAARRGLPIVQTLHNFRLLCPQAMFLRNGRICEDCIGRIPWRAVTRACYRGSVTQSAITATMLAFHRKVGTYGERVTRFIALNEFCKSLFVRGGISEEKIDVKPNFISIEDAQEVAHERHGGLYVGRLSAEKGLSTLSEALRGPGYPTVTVVGSGPQADLVSDHPNLIFAGTLDAKQVYATMRAASYLVMPSLWYENFPRTLVEAFACGLPVIASRTGALAELVSHGETGLLFEPGSAEELWRAIQWAEEHPEDMARMGKNALRTFRERYTPEQNYELLMGIYGRALGAD